MMKFRNVENRLAVLAAVIVLLGVSSAAEDAFAGENTAAGLEVTISATMSPLSAGNR